MAHRIIIQLYCIDDAARSAALSQHQGDQAAAGADIKHSLRLLDRCPGAEQDAIRAHFHGTTVMIDMELLEGKSAATPHLAPVIRKMVGDYSGYPTLAIGADEIIAYNLPFP